MSCHMNTVCTYPFYKGSLCDSSFVVSVSELADATAAAAADLPSTRRVVNPTPLREALSEMTHRSFRVGEMNDANELLDTIYDCIALADPSTASGMVRGTRGQIVDSSFGLMVSEAVQCGQCGKVTHQVGEHFEHMLVVSAASLQLCNACTDTNSFGELLRTVQEQEKKTCDKDVGGCGMEQVSKDKCAGRS